MLRSATFEILSWPTELLEHFLMNKKVLTDKRSARFARIWLQKYDGDFSVSGLCQEVPSTEENSRNGTKNSFILPISSRSMAEDSPTFVLQ